MSRQSCCGVSCAVVAVVSLLSSAPGLAALVTCNYQTDCFDAGKTCQSYCDGGAHCSQMYCCGMPQQTCATAQDCCPSTSEQCSGGICCNTGVNPVELSGLGNPALELPCNTDKDCCNPGQLGPSTGVYCNTNKECLTCGQPGLVSFGPTQTPCGTGTACCPTLDCKIILYGDDAGGTINGGNFECCSALGKPCVTYNPPPNGWPTNDSCCPFNDADPAKRTYDTANIKCGSLGVCCEKANGKCTKDADCCDHGTCVDGGLGPTCIAAPICH
jgi:hypothetical protein